MTIKDKFSLTLHTTYKNTLLLNIFKIKKGENRSQLLVVTILDGVKWEKLQGGGYIHQKLSCVSESTKV